MSDDNENEIDLSLPENLTRFINYYKEKFGQIAFSLVIDPSLTITPVSSRIGGLPYWNFSRPYPCNEDHETLRFLCQINLAELPSYQHLVQAHALSDKASAAADALPKQGLLQFFAAPSDTYGCTFEADNSDFSVVYWQDAAAAATAATAHAAAKSAYAAATSAPADANSASPDAAAADSSAVAATSAENAASASTEASESANESTTESKEAAVVYIIPEADLKLTMEELRARLAEQGLDEQRISNLFDKNTDYFWPISHECGLRIVAGIDLPHFGDSETFDDCLSETLEAVFGLDSDDEDSEANFDYMDQLSDNEVYTQYIEYLLGLSEADNNKFAGSLLGYPDFTQDNPISYEGTLASFDTLLLRLDMATLPRNKKKPTFDMMWGDAGVADIFINSEKLKALDFSEPFYTWDCC